MPAVKSSWKKLRSLTKKDGLRQHEEQKYTTLRETLRVVESVCGGRRKQQTVEAQGPATKIPQPWKGQCRQGETPLLD